MAMRQPRKPSIGLNSASSRARSASFLGSAPMAAATSAISSSPCGRNSCSGGSSSRMVTGRPPMISNSSTKSARCIGNSLAKRGAARFLVVGQDHLAHRLDALLVEEHVLGAAEPDAFGAEPHRRLGVGRRVGIGAHAELAHFVGPADQRGKFAGELRLDHVDLAGQHLAGRAVDGDEFALLVRLAARRHGPRGIVDAQRAGAGDAGLAHAARDHRGVRGHAAAGGEDAFGGVHAVDVFGRGLHPHQDHFLAVGFELRRPRRARTRSRRWRRPATPAGRSRSRCGARADRWSGAAAGRAPADRRAAPPRFL